MNEILKLMQRLTALNKTWRYVRDQFEQILQTVEVVKFYFPGATHETWRVRVIECLTAMSDSGLVMYVAGVCVRREGRGFLSFYSIEKVKCV